MIKIELSESERKELRRLHRKYREKKAADKIKAMVMAADGYNHQEIARILFIDEDTLTSWKRKFLERKTSEDWLETNYLCNATKLEKDQKRMVSDFVENSRVISSQQVSEFIKERFGKNYSTSGTVHLLHELGFSYKQTTLIPSKYDEEKQKEFHEKYEELKKNLKSKETILFMDGVHPTHNTVTTKMWIKKGEQKLVKSNTGRQRININGVYNPLSQEVMVQEDQTINAQSTITFLEKVEKHYENKEKIFIIADNARYYRSRLVQDYLKMSTIEILFLPPYSPNLNLIERLWKFTRKKTMNSHYYENFKDFKTAVMGFFEHIEDHHDELQQFIGTKLHLFKNPNSFSR